MTIVKSKNNAPSFFATSFTPIRDLHKIAAGLHLSLCGIGEQIMTVAPRPFASLAICSMYQPKV